MSRKKAIQHYRGAGSPPIALIGELIFKIDTGEIYTSFDGITNTLIYPQVLNASTKILTELFFLESYKIPSISFPSLCLNRLYESDSKTHILNSSNWSLLVPELRNIQWNFNNSTDIPYSGFSIDNQCIISLTSENSSLVNQPLVTAITDMIRYYNDLDWSEALTLTHYENANLTINFNGEDCRIISHSSIAGIETITIDYNSTGLSTVSGNLKIYPHRMPSTLTSSGTNTAQANFATQAQVRKIKPETSLSAGYSPGMLLENRFQGHIHIDSGHSHPYGDSYIGNVGYDTTIDNISNIVNNDFGNLILNQNTGIASAMLSNPSYDGTNGIPRTGKTTRSNQLSVFVYMFGGLYTA
jgi:hypothetical protein